MYINLEIAIKYCNSERLFQIVKSNFLINYKTFESELRTLYGADNEKLHMYIHSLKGISLNIGAQKLYEYCCKIKNPFKDYSISTTEFEGFINIFNLTYNELESL